MSIAERFQQMEKGFDLPQAMAEADRCLLCHDPPCSKGCPAETDPGTFIRKLRLRNVTGAIRTIKTNNALGGRVRRALPDPAALREGVQRHGHLPARRDREDPARARRARLEDRRSRPRTTGPRRARRRSPSWARARPGSPARRSWRRQGFAVTVFEERAEPGGIIRYGVPAYRFDASFPLARARRPRVPRA